MLTPADLAGPANPLAAHYTRFRVGERLLLTGHSHQAWPDAAFDGQVEAFEDAARLVDDKWERAEAMAWRVRRGVAQRLGESDPSRIALGASTGRSFSRLTPGGRSTNLHYDGSSSTHRSRSKLPCVAVFQAASASSTLSLAFVVFALFDLRV